LHELDGGVTHGCGRRIRSYLADGDAIQKQAARQKAFRRAINDAQASGVIVIRDIGHLTWTWLASGQAERDICQEKPH
jgi:hypothetical protein